MFHFWVILECSSWSGASQRNVTLLFSLFDTILISFWIQQIIWSVCTPPLVSDGCNWRVSCKKGIQSIAFGADFHFLQDQASFWQTNLFWHEDHCSNCFCWFKLCFQEITCMYGKSSDLLLCQCATAKMFISLKYSKMLISCNAQARCWISCWRLNLRCWFPLTCSFKDFDFT